MRLTVEPIQPTPSASVTTTRISASVSVVEPTAGVVVQVPIASIAHIALVVSTTSATALAAAIYESLAFDAFIDETGRFRYIADIQAMVDATALVVDKALADETAALSYVALSLTKTAADTQAVTDALTRAVAKYAEETLALSELRATDFAKLLVDTLELADEPMRVLKKTFGDGVAMNDSFESTDGSLYQFMKNIMNMAFTSDTLQRDIDKHLADTPYALERKYVQFTKAPIFDEFFQTDTPRLTPSLNKFDSTQGFTDASTASLHKRVFDVISFMDTVDRVLVTSAVDLNLASVADAYFLGTDKALSETVNASDVPRVTPNKVALESVSVTDLATVTLVYIRAFSDLALAQDQKSLSTSKTFADSTTTQENTIAVLTKTLSDAFGLNDMAGVGDGSTYFLARAIANVAFMTDNLARLVQPSKSDLLSVADSGRLVMQGYCDLTFFAEDYVGATRSF